MRFPAGASRNLLRASVAALRGARKAQVPRVPCGFLRAVRLALERSLRFLAGGFPACPRHPALARFTAGYAISRHRPSRASQRMIACCKAAYQGSLARLSKRASSRPMFRRKCFVAVFDSCVYAAVLPVQVQDWRAADCPQAAISKCSGASALIASSVPRHDHPARHRRQ